jgi:hypothetical protein
MTYARRTDSTHKAVVEAFRAAGWHVLSTFRLPNAPDLFVAKAGRTVAVEVKGPKTKLSPGQASWLSDWPGETAVVRGIEDVMALSRLG